MTIPALVHIAFHAGAVAQIDHKQLSPSLAWALQYRSVPLQKGILLNHNNSDQDGSLSVRSLCRRRTGFSLSSLDFYYLARAPLLMFCRPHGRDIERRSCISFVFAALPRRYPLCPLAGTKTSLTKSKSSNFNSFKSLIVAFMFSLKPTNLSCGSVV
jgi:hypothetical protein